MKKSEIISAHKIIGALNLSTFDKELRMALLKNFLAFSKVKKEFDNDLEALREKMFGERQEEAQEIEELKTQFSKAREIRNIEKMKTIDAQLAEHKDFFKKEIELTELVNDILKEDIEVEVAPVDQEKYIDTLSENNVPFTARDIETLSIIFE